jgi:hypothetical protein
MQGFVNTRLLGSAPDVASRILRKTDIQQKTLAK